MCMCMYVYVCTYPAGTYPTDMCVYMYVYVCVCVCMCMYVCVCVCMYISSRDLPNRFRLLSLFWPAGLRFWTDHILCTAAMRDLGDMGVDESLSWLSLTVFDGSLDFWYCFVGYASCRTWAYAKCMCLCVCMYVCMYVTLISRETMYTHTPGIYTYIDRYVYCACKHTRFFYLHGELAHCVDANQQRNDAHILE
jgi:hypothetical protein